MDSSRYHQNYGQWHAPYSPHHPSAPLLPPPPPPPHQSQSHPESPNFCDRSIQIGGQRQDYHHYTHCQDLPQKPTVNQPSSYYSQPPPPPPQQHPPLPPLPQNHLQYIPKKVGYEPQRISQPSSSTIPCTESRDVSQSVWAGFKEKRLESWTIGAAQGRMDVCQGRMDTCLGRLDPDPGLNYQYDNSYSSRDSPGVSINRGLDGSSRSRDEFRNLECVRKEPGATRIDENYHDRGQLKSEPVRYFRGLDEGNKGLSSSVGYGSDRYGVTVSGNMTRSSASHEGDRNQRWDQAQAGERFLYPRKKTDNYHSEIEQYFDRERRDKSNEPNRTPRKQMQKKSALLRLETPRSHQNGRETDWSRHHSRHPGKRVNSNSFRGREHLGHSDHGLLEKRRGKIPVNLDVSFKSNVMVAKPNAGVHNLLSMKPRSSKARRALVSATVRYGKLRTRYSDEALLSEGSRQSTRQTTASENEKKPDNHSTPSSSDAGSMLNKVRFVDGVVQDTRIKISNTSHDSKPKVLSTVHTAEKISSFCEALKEAREDTNVEHDSNWKVVDGEKSILNSHEDVLDRKSSVCNVGKGFMRNVMEKEEIVKAETKVNTSSIKLPVSCPTATDISGCSGGGIQFSGKSMCSVGSQPCEDEDMDFIPSWNLPVMDVDVGFEEKKTIGSSKGSLGYGEKDYEKSSVGASIYFNSKDAGDQLLAKSNIDGVEDDNNAISKNVDSLSPKSSRGCCTGPASSASPEVANVLTELANANNSVSGDLANANSFTVGTYTHIMVKSSDSGNTSNPSVENLSRKESIETVPLNSTAELADNLDRDESLKTCVKGTMMSLTKLNGSSHVLPVERGDSCSRSDESDLVMAVPSDMCTENVCTERLVLAEDMDLASHHPAEVPSSDQFGDSDNQGLKRCFPEPNVSLSKDVTDGSSECLVEQDVSQNASTFCDSLPRSSAFVMETNLALGINCMSGNETVTDAEPGLHDTQPCLTVCKVLAEDRFGCGSSGAIGSVWNLSMDKDLEKDPSRVSSCFISNSSVNPCHISPLVAVNELIQNKISVNANCNDSQGGIMHKENSCAEKVEVDTQGEKKPSGGTFKYSRTQGTDIDAVSGDSVFPCDSLPNSLRQDFRKIQSEIHVATMVDETSKNRAKLKPSGGTSKNRTLRSDSIPCDSLSSSSSEKLNGDTVEKLTDVTSDVASQEKYSPNSAQTDIYDGEALSSDENVSRTVILGDSGQCLSKSLAHADIKDHVVSGRQCATALSSRYEIDKRKKQSNYSQKSYPRSLPFVSGTKKDANPQTHITKHHTWHRKSDFTTSPFVAAKPSSSTLSTQQEFPIGTAQSSSSYVRKGNSLLRQPSYGSPGVALGLPPTAIQLNRIEDKSMGSASMVDLGNTSFLVKTGELPTLGIQAKPPLDSNTSKVSNAIAIPSGKCVLSYSMDHLTSGSPESTMDSATSGEANDLHSGGDTFKISETLIQTGYASDCQQKRNLPNMDDSNLKKMVYVKRKANQLVAASDIHCASKRQIPPSDSYFKRSKNQLVRNSESRVNPSPDSALDSQAAATMVSERSSTSTFSDSAVTRPYKRSKFSLVWTQNDLQSRLPINHMRYQRILPQLVPWKRVTYWRRLVNSVSAFRNGSLPNISPKLSMMRKRHTVYTRSTNGYSLRKSKVLSITGSHLKWSKSIERDSRKANEEATLAVAAFAKKECEKHSAQINARKTSRNYLARERIFRFGSLRYRMDSSRRTLQRISDVDSPCSGARENGKGVKRPFIPKRLVIGNEEYVRVGTGNQLVRDPKKRTRALANEKVRWSLHNVRLRLAKKKYCQFFTRFGKCNKDDGKCPYVHDPSKIAVCTKFLNGLCANTKCKLTHKVIPERMPDCSYFLQGLCNNEACPYRHVHVNPSAAICDGFLKGYCSDGDECQKKHSYTCPVFEATGSCSQGSKCKLHHPKNQSKGRKRKRPSEPSQKNARGRYFGSLHKGLSESEPMVVDRRPTDSEVSGVEGLDFITLGASEDEYEDNSDPGPEQSVSSDNEAPVSIYNLIRPVALMQ